MSERRRADHTPSPAPTGPDPTSRRTCPPCTAPAAALPADVLVHSVGERGGGLRDPTSVQDRFSISRIDAEYGRSVAGTGYGLDTGGSTIGFPRKERKERRKSEYSLIRKSASPIVQKTEKKKHRRALTSPATANSGTDAGTFPAEYGNGACRSASRCQRGFK
jgi:hypothetical protein